MLWDLLESFICGSENGVVGLCAVQELDEVVILVDELCKFCGVLALADKLAIVSADVSN